VLPFLSGLMLAMLSVSFSLTFPLFAVYAAVS
jgi:hypothetical protein